jgi:hypothetical protein
VTIFRGIAAVGMAAAVFIIVGCGSSGSATFVGTAAVSTPLGPPTEIIPTADPVTVSPKPAPKPTVPVGTFTRSNAVSKGQQYLGVQAFSRPGLIAQLVSEGFSTANATYAVDTIHPDWNAQAAKKAKRYLNLESLSRQGLLARLTFDGFTRDQAEFGASQAGL